MCIKYFNLGKQLTEGIHADSDSQLIILNKWAQLQRRGEALPRVVLHSQEQNPARPITFTYMPGRWRRGRPGWCWQWRQEVQETRAGGAAGEARGCGAPALAGSPWLGPPGSARFSPLPAGEASPPSAACPVIAQDLKRASFVLETKDFRSDSGKRADLRFGS